MKILLVHFFGLTDVDLLLIWMNNFQLCSRFRRESCPVLPPMLIISRGECIYQFIFDSTLKDI